MSLSSGVCRLDLEGDASDEQGDEGADMPEADRIVEEPSSTTASSLSVMERVARRDERSSMILSRLSSGSRYSPRIVSKRIPE